MKKRKLLLLITTGLLLLIAITGCANKVANVDKVDTDKSAQGDEKPEADSDMLKQDFYEAVNKDWLEENQIAADKMQISAFSILADDTDKLVRDDFNEMLKTGAPSGNKPLSEALKYYELTIDFEKREKDGVAPVMPYIKRIEDLKSLADISADIGELMDELTALPFGFAVQADMEDATQKSVWSYSAGMILPDKSYYDTDTGDQLLEAYSDMGINLLKMIGKTDEEAAKIAKQAIEFDKLMVPYMKTSEENSVVVNMYNPIAYEDFVAYSKNIDLGAALSKLTNGKQIDQIIVINTNFFEAFDTIINEDNFEQLKSWMIVNTLNSMTNYLNEEYRQTASTYSMMLTGMTEISPKEEIAYNTMWSGFNEVVGDYYGRKYFGDEAKADVTKMVDDIVSVYKNRLNNNEWLGETTKLEAIKKLDAMAINVGYPDEIRPIFKMIEIKSKEDGGNLLDNAMSISKLSYKDMFDAIDEPVNRMEWVLTADTVNAMYSLTSNSINFPAAFLQAPYYSLEQSASQNYGGVGAVIAHEISHAFDSNGASYDLNGNISNWWTEEDSAEFSALCEAMIAEFDGIPFGDGAVNGTLTVSENVADAGGLSCALEITKALPEANLEEFFTNWAVIWHEKSTPEVVEMLLTGDVHAPSKLRANIIVQNFEEFFETFDIKEGDGMWRAPEDRVKIW